MIVFFKFYIFAIWSFWNLAALDFYSEDFTFLLKVKLNFLEIVSSCIYFCDWYSAPLSNPIIFLNFSASSFKYLFYSSSYPIREYFSDFLMLMFSLFWSINYFLHYLRSCFIDMILHSPNTLLETGDLFSVISFRNFMLSLSRFIIIVFSRVF